MEPGDLLGRPGGAGGIRGGRVHAGAAGPARLRQQLFCGRPGRSRREQPASQRLPFPGIHGRGASVSAAAPLHSASERLSPRRCPPVLPPPPCSLPEALGGAQFPSAQPVFPGGGLPWGPRPPGHTRHPNRSGVSPKLGPPCPWHPFPSPCSSLPPAWLQEFPRLDMFLRGARPHPLEAPAASPASPQPHPPPPGSSCGGWVGALTTMSEPHAPGPTRVSH